MIQKTGLDAFTEFNRASVIAVGVPIMILAGIATYFNSRASVARQSPEAAANPQTAMMNKLALYVFPLGVVVGGPFLPLAIILYWFANNIWTFGQQHYVFGKIEQEEEAKKQEAIARRAANAPAPGVKPNRAKRPAKELIESEGVEDSAVPDSVEDSPPGKVEDTSTGTGTANKTPPRPGARPNRKPKR